MKILDYNQAAYYVFETISNYKDRFDYIERVLYSCRTIEQLKVATDWALQVITRYRTYELDKIDKSKKMVPKEEVRSVIKNDIREFFYHEKDVVDSIFNLMKTKLTMLIKNNNF